MRLRKLTSPKICNQQVADPGKADDLRPSPKTSRLQIQEELMVQCDLKAGKTDVPA